MNPRKLISRMRADGSRWPASVISVRTGLALAMAFAMSACAAAPERQSEFSAVEPFISGSAALAKTGAPSATHPPAQSATMTPSPITTGSIRTSSPVAPQASTLPPQTPHQRCEQLRQDGVVWERTRKLAILNRGEAGAQMADLHTPWTKENVAFYVASCNGRKAKTAGTGDKSASRASRNSKQLASAME